MKMPERKERSDLYQCGTGGEVWMEKSEPEEKAWVKTFGIGGKALGDVSGAGAHAGYPFHP